MKNLVIDIHAHFTPKLVFERFDAHAAKFSGVKFLRDDKGVRMQFPGGEVTRPVSPKLSDLADRRAWMDKNGIDHQLVGGWLDLFGYELPAQEGCMEPFSPTACGPASRRTAFHAAGDRIAPRRWRRSPRRSSKGFYGADRHRPMAREATRPPVMDPLREASSRPARSTCTRCFSAANRGWPITTS
jgi:hypothetical protein